MASLNTYGSRLNLIIKVNCAFEVINLTTWSQETWEHSLHFSVPYLKQERHRQGWSQTGLLAEQSHPISRLKLSFAGNWTGNYKWDIPRFQVWPGNEKFCSRLLERNFRLVFPGMGNWNSRWNTNSCTDYQHMAKIAQSCSKLPTDGQS